VNKESFLLFNPHLTHTQGTLAVTIDEILSFIGFPKWLEKND
jgi:hypothetical protein